MTVVTVVIFVTLVIVTVATVAIGTVVIVTYFSKNNLKTDEISQGSFSRSRDVFLCMTAQVIEVTKNYIEHQITRKMGI